MVLLNTGMPAQTAHFIFVVEDETDLADLVRRYLEGEGYECRVITRGDQVLVEAGRRRPELILLDRMLPGISGDEVAARLKRDPSTAGIPIIMLTAKAEEADQLVGFALGAEDYISKPFSMKVLAARVAALLRRRGDTSGQADEIEAGPLRISSARHEVTIDGTPVTLTLTEFRLLAALVKARGRVLDRSKLIDLALGADTVVVDRTIDVHITAVRKKLGKAALWIQTIRGVGYTFRPPDQSCTRQA